jgi:hypothetical protein
MVVPYLRISHLPDTWIQFSVLVELLRDDHVCSDGMEFFVRLVCVHVLCNLQSSGGDIQF